VNGDASVLQQAYAGRSVWLSGHTGFKGAWLASWLLKLGANVRGFSLEPPTTPSLFDQIGLADRLEHEHGDLRDPAAVKRSILSTRPDFVFHLAAQAIVRTSFEEPVLTYSTNVMGTLHVLEALRDVEKPCAAVLVTSDKCYENTGSASAYREEDPLGGRDPYSSSKGCAEIAIASWRRTFFEDGPVRVASARAGNCIGGGDWANDRIVPDCIRALQAGKPVAVRNPAATRPWQHVLDPLSGYLWLGASLTGRDTASAFNFGPAAESSRTVEQLVKEVLKHWPGSWTDASDPAAPHEARFLSLDTGKARNLLGWAPIWDFEQAVEATVEWYRAGRDLVELTQRQIERFEDDAAQAAAPWAVRLR
jgi:CDP-glucose 4,6-dehydratase